MPFRTVEGVERPFRRELRARYAAHAESLGLSRRAGLPAEVRARIRTDLALEWFRDAEGREPKGDLELTSAVARWSRPAPAPVGGYDLTFSPVKSVSALWALAPPEVAARIEAGAPGRGRRCAGLAGGPCVVQPGGYGGGTSGERHRVGRRLVHPPRQPGRRPGPAHPRRRRQQGPNPGRVAGCRSTGGCCMRRRPRSRRPTTPPWKPASPTSWGCGSPTGRAGTGPSGRSARSSESTRRCSPGGRPAGG